MPNRDDGAGVNGYRYKYQGQEVDPETGKEAFELRLWDSRIGRWLTTDPAGQYHSPYLGMGNSPINGVDPDGGKFYDEWTQLADGSWEKTSNLGGDEFHVWHHTVGENAGLTEILSGSDSDVSFFIKPGADVLKNFVLRNENVDYMSIFNEFKKGYGPKRSLFEGDHPMVEDMKFSYAAYKARDLFLNNGGERGYVGVGFGIAGILRSTTNMTEQMVGSVGASVYPLGDENVIIMLADTKTPRSLFYHLPGLSSRYNRDFNPRNILMPYSETKQTYIWIESVKTLKQKHYLYDTRYDSDW